MKKKLSVLLCVLVAMLCFTACGSKKENLQYDKSTITQATDFLIEYCNSADADTIEQWNKMTDFQIESQLNQAGVPFTKDSFLAALAAIGTADTPAEPISGLTLPCVATHISLPNTTHQVLLL